MEDLLRSLRGLGLLAPRSDQLLELVTAQEDTQAQQKLAQLLALGRKDGEEDVLLSKDLLDAGVQALLENFYRTLRKEKELLLGELAAPPKPIKLVPRKALLARQEAEVKRSRESYLSAEGYHPRLIFDGGPKYYSKTPVGLLRPIPIKNLKAPFRHTGSSLLVRVITPLQLYVGCTFIVEDQAGDAIPVSISHFTSNLHLHGEALNELLPVGTVIVIREPYVSTNHLSHAGPCSGKGSVGVRVDSPSDVFVTDVEGGMRWPGELRAPKHTYASASALWLSEGPISEILFDEYSVTKKDVISAVEHLRRQGRVGAARRELVAAESLFPDPEFESLDAALTSPKVSKLSEETIAEMYFGTSSKVNPRFDVEEKVGPVAVRDIPGAGRGLVLTRDVQPGELLLCCKAMGGSYADDEGCAGIPVIRINLLDGVISTTTQILAATNVIHTLIDQPNLALPFLGLTAGPKLPYSEYVRKPYPLRWSKEPPLERDLMHVDAAYVDGVLRFNAFGPGRISQSDAESDGGELGRSTMPHPLPAILNHSCLPNASSVFFGDMVTTRALHALPKGTEIMHQYVKGEQPYAVRTAQLSKHEFECQCQLCKLDRADGNDNLQQRQKLIGGTLPALLERARMVLKGQNDVSAIEETSESLEAFVGEVDATYAPSRKHLKPELLKVWTTVAQLRRGRDTERAITALKNALAAVNVQALDQPQDGRMTNKLPDLYFDAAVECMLNLAELYHNSSPETSIAWVRAAYWCHQCMINGGKRVFLDRWAGGDSFKRVLDAWQKSPA